MFIILMYYFVGLDGIIKSFKLSLVVLRFLVVDLFLIADNVKVIHGVSMYVMSTTYVRKRKRERESDLN